MSCDREANKQEIANGRRWAAIYDRAAFTGHVDGYNWFMIRIPGDICQDFVAAVDGHIAPTVKPLEWHAVLQAVEERNVDVLRAFIAQEDQKGR